MRSAALLVAAIIVCSAEASEKPNILLLIADDYGVDQSRLYTKSAAPTPNIEALAADGVVFESLWAASSCSPARATLLTGQLGFRKGNGVPWVIAGGDPRMGIDSRLDEPHYLPRLLGEFGYDTGLVGKWHISSSAPTDPIRAGFDFWAGTLGSFGRGDGAPQESVAAYWGTTSELFQCYGDQCDAVPLPTPPAGWPVPAEYDQNYRTTWEVDRAIDWLEGREDPWFLWMGFQSPHSPLQLPPEKLVAPELTEKIKAKLGAYEAGFWAKVADDRATSSLVFQAMVSALDTEIGRLLDSIDLSNTVVIFIGDNGTIGQVAHPRLVPRRHAKGSQFEGGLNVPFVFSAPGVSEKGSRSAVLTHISDIYATALDLAGSAVDENGRPEAATNLVEIDGLSLVPHVFDGEPGVYGRRYVVSSRMTYSWANPKFPGRLRFVPGAEGDVIRDERFKLHRRTVSHPGTGFVCLQDPQPSEENPVPCDTSQRVKEFSFYDLAEDPQEKVDLLAGGIEELTDNQREAFERLNKALSEVTYPTRTTTSGY